MTTATTDIELRQVELPAGPARAAVFHRTYPAAIEDVWDACTDPERLSRWYAPVEGDLRVGGTFTQGDFGVGTLAVCEAPHRLVVALGGGSPVTDQIELRLVAIDAETTALEFSHATTRDSNEIGGQIFDAVHCMGGGYGPRMITLQQELAGTLPADLDIRALHLRPESEYRDAISGSMAELDRLLAG